MTDKRKALMDISKAASETGNPIVIGRAVMNHWPTIRQALSEPEIEDAELDEEVAEAIAWLEFQMKYEGDYMAQLPIRKNIKTLINAANPVKKWTRADVEDTVSLHVARFCLTNNVNITDAAIGSLEAINALIQAGVIQVKEG